MNIEKINNNSYFNDGLMIIISSPSGAGKTTLCQKISKEDKKISLSISYTTRKKRISEIEGKHYKFISNNKFINMKKNNNFLESAYVFGNNYGTSIKHTMKIIKKNKDILFDIDWQGAKQIRRKFPKHVVDIFIFPPSLSELKKRLIKRGQDDSKTVKKRMKTALNEMIHYNEYKFVLINKNLFQTINEIKKIIVFERDQRKNLKKINAILGSTIKL